MKKILLPSLILLPLVLGVAGCISSSSPSPPEHTTVVVPPNTTVVCPAGQAC